MNSVLQDFRHVFRFLLRARGFTTVAVAALALAIGGNTAIFGVVNAVLIREPGYKDPDQLVIVWEHNLPRDKKNNVVSPGNYLHWRELNASFSEMAGVSPTGSATLTGVGEPEEISTQIVTATLFPLLGVQPQVGRPFTVDEDRPGNSVAVISDRLWRRKFNADPGILTRGITLHGVAYTVTGVMPPAFSILDDTVDVWMAAGLPEAARTPRGRWMTVVARLKPGVTRPRAQQDMTRVATEMVRLFPDFNTGWTARVAGLQEELTGQIRRALLVLFAAVALVLLIACANVANLLLARGASRQRELAVRAALGATRLRLVQQLLAESAILAVLGGIGGVILGTWLLHVMRVAVAERLAVPQLDQAHLDATVLAFSAAVSILSALAFGIVPALTAAGGILTDNLKDGGRQGSSARGSRTRAVVVIAEVALALVLLIGSALLVRSFLRLLEVDAGFNPRQTLTMRLSLPSSRYTGAEELSQFFNRLFDRIDALPGITASGATSFLPLTGLGAATNFEIVGRPSPPKGEGPVTDVRVVANNYFAAMGIPVVAGRVFSPADRNDRTNRVVINATLARHHWPGEDPIGKRIRVSWGGSVEDEIIGVVGDVRNASLDSAARPTVYWPYERQAYGRMTLAIRSSVDHAALARSVVEIVRQQDPQLAVGDVRTMQDVIARSVGQQRVTTLVLAIFAATALLLAALGIYGVISYSVSLRTQEIGIRMALGGRRSDILRMIVRYAVALTLAGIAIGALAALILTQGMASLLFETAPADPVTFGAAATLLAIVAAGAGLIPALRATRVDPVVALRGE